MTARRRPARTRRVAALALGLAVTVSGCTGGGSASHGSQAPTPAAPVAAPSGASTPDLDLLARPAATPTGSPQRAAAVLARAAAGTGTSAQAALRRALELSGFDLVGADGSVVAAAAAPRLGIRVPVGEVLLMSGRNDGVHAVDASDLTGAMTTVMGVDHDELALRQGLLDGLRFQAAASRPRVRNNYPDTLQFLSRFIIDLGKRARPSVDLTRLGLRDVRFTGLQAWLIWLGIAAGMAQGGALVATDHDAPAAYPFLPVGPVLRGAAQGDAATATRAACPAMLGSVAPSRRIRPTFSPGGASATPWSGLVGTVAATSNTGSKPFEPADYRDWARVALSFAQLLAIGQVLTGDVTMSGSPVLDRTRSTSAPGEQRDLVLAASSRLGTGQYAACVRTLLNSSAPTFTVPNDGPIGAGAGVSWAVDDDPAGPLNDPVALVTSGAGDGGRTVDSATGSQGTARVAVQGRPQRYPVASGAEQYTREVRLTASVQVPTALAASVLTPALAPLLAGQGAAATAAATVARQLRFFSVQRVLRVHDWVKDFLLTGTFDRPAPRVHRYTAVSGTKCGGIAGTWVIDPQLTVRLDAKGRGKVTGPVGGTTVVRLELGPPAQMTVRNDLAAQSFQVVPGNFCP